MQKILVTGASGYIGSCFIKKFCNDYEFVSVSLRDGIPASFSDINTVIHLSALVHQTKKHSDSSYFEINTRQTESLAKEAKNQGVSHFVFFSTVAVYGVNGYLNRQTTVINEESECHPVSAYAKSKLAAERILLNMETDGFKVSIVRPPIVYGEDCPGNMKNLKALIRWVPVLPFNYQNNKRSMVNIDNLLKFTKQVIDEKATGILIPQDIDKYSIKQITNVLSAGLNRKVLLFRFPDLIFSMLVKIKPQVMSSLYGTLVFDSTISNQKTKYVEQVTTQEGLRSM